MLYPLICYSLEPISKCDYCKDFFNWTITYRTESEIWYPHGTVKKKLNKAYKFPTYKMLTNRSRKVAWFVDKCYTAQANLSNKYVEILSQYIPVDIYGDCGSYICQPNKSDINDPCYKMLEKTYKFYLSFEDINCRDYVTKNLYNIFQYDIVPVVFGNFDYNKITPPMSVISAKYFDTPEDLGNYLNMLDTSYTTYVKYLEWKESYVVKSYSPEYVLCQLCEELNQPLNHYFYKDVADWFDNSCADIKIIPEWLFY